MIVPLVELNFDLEIAYRNYQQLHYLEALSGPWIAYTCECYC